MEAQAALDHKTAELQAVLRVLPDLFFRFDALGHFLDFSAPISSDLYAPAEVFLGKHPRDVLPPHLVEMMERVRAESLATGALATLEYDLEVKGKAQRFEARYVPFIDGQTIAIVRNITARHQAETALRASEARLRESQKIEAVGRLAGGVAHDFNNLLMIILGYASAIERAVAPNHPIASAVDEIRKAGQRATALTKQLLALSRRQPKQPTVLDLAAVLSDMHSMLLRVIGENIRFSSEVDPQLRCVCADRSQIEQVLLNLVLNACDAMPGGGRLEIEAHNITADDARHVRLIVSDTGSGMDPETRARIFEPFFTTKPHGTGLGLSTVYRIIEECAGRIEVASAAGAGTRFTMLLPAVDESPDRAASSPPAKMSRGHETVLVVENEEAVRALVVRLLGELGYTTLSAGSAEEAIEQLERDARGPDLLLTDIVMGGITGWELAAKVTARYPRCRVLYMSGHAIGLAERDRSLSLRHDLLHKPFPPEVLAARVRKALDRSAASR